MPRARVGHAERLSLVVVQGPADAGLQRHAEQRLDRRREEEAHLVRAAVRQEDAGRELNRPMDATPTGEAEEAAKPKPKPPIRRESDQAARHEILQRFEVVKRESLRLRKPYAVEDPRGGALFDTLEQKRAPVCEEAARLPASEYNRTTGSVPDKR